MKKLASFVAIVSLGLTLSACSQKQDERALNNAQTPCATCFTKKTEPLYETEFHPLNEDEARKHYKALKQNRH